MRIFILLLSVTLCVSLLQADTIHVPSQQPTIQAGIDATSEGDTVLVADGVYMGVGNKNLDFGGVNMVVKSENGYDYTTIDCENDGRAFYFHTSEDTTAVVEGFELVNGNIDFGGSIYIESSSPKITNCRISNNSVDYGGGGISIHDSHAIMRHCTITGNSSGGLDESEGGGIWMGYSSGLQIMDCEINQNWAGFKGGGIGCWYSDAIIERCVITDNIADYEGGGVSNDHSSLTFRCNEITGNVAQEGGGIFFWSGNCPEISNCTIADNIATHTDGGGIELRSHANLFEVKNSIIWDNEPYGFRFDGDSLGVRYSDVQGGWVGEGNIDVDPLFLGGSPVDYHLTENSPCIDTGDPLSPLDPDGSRADMGAYYFDQTPGIILVPDEYPTIQAGIDAAIDGDTVLVADGTYTGDGNNCIDFLGKAIVVMSENGADSCIIDCEAAEIGFQLVNEEDTLSVIHGFTIVNAHQSAIVCDFSNPRILRNLILNNGETNLYGGGVFVGNSPHAVIIKNNTFDGNSAINAGAALCVLGGGSAVFQNNIISNSIGAEAIACEGNPPSPIFNSYNDFWNNGEGDYGIHVSPGEGEIYEDPLYVGGIPFDYHLDWYSPCINAGDPNSPLDPDSTRADMGAYYHPHEGVMIGLFPDTTYYHRADTLGCTVMASNHTDSSVVLEGWTTAEDTLGMIILPPLGPVNVFISAHNSISSHLSQVIHDSKPLGGPYIYKAMVGTYPDEILAEDFFEFFITPPTLTLDIVPDTTDCLRGDSLRFTISITNEEDETFNFQRWTEVETPWGLLISPSIGPDDVVIDSAEVITEVLSQQIPWGTPFGSPYTCRVKVGNYPDEVFYESSFEFSIVYPKLELDATPDTTHYQQGDSLGFTVDITNNEEITVYFQRWTEVETPWGLVISPSFGPTDMSLDGYEFMSEYINQLIPQQTPYGSPYIYRVFVGDYPEHIFKEDSFEFSVVPPGKY